jgi:hypothetical protein
MPSLLFVLLSGLGFMKPAVQVAGLDNFLVGTVGNDVSFVEYKNSVG